MLHVFGVSCVLKFSQELYGVYGDYLFDRREFEEAAVGESRLLQAAGCCAEDFCVIVKERLVYAQFNRLIT